MNAAGVVKNLARPEDFPGQYPAIQGESTLIAGAVATTMKNTADNVVMDLVSRTQGLGWLQCAGFDDQNERAATEYAACLHPKVRIQ